MTRACVARGSATSRLTRGSPRLSRRRVRVSTPPIIRVENRGDQVDTVNV
jgi:hypothetical protein